jgi:hypothetical protein
LPPTTAPQGGKRHAAITRCRTITVHLFRGDRLSLGRRIRQTLDDQKHGRGPGPSIVECLLYIGHTGVSTDRRRTILGFNPDFGGRPTWHVMDRLRNGDALTEYCMTTRTSLKQLNSAGYQSRHSMLSCRCRNSELFNVNYLLSQKRCHYSYGFPNGDGDCNCTTWLERMGLPLLTGSMDEFVGIMTLNPCRRRRFGRCI